MKPASHRIAGNQRLKMQKKFSSPQELFIKEYMFTAARKC